jgi:hypothetical protein
MQAVVFTPLPRAFIAVLVAVLPWSGASLAADLAHAGAAPVARETTALTKPTRVHAGATNPLDRRVELLARELDLDAVQQLKVRSLLLGQREQIVQVWQDETVPGALRVARTQAISERTEDGIRALLTDVQRQKYLKPRPDRAPMGATSDDLATYVDRMNRR